MQFFSKFIGLWNELDNYVKILACTYGASTKIAVFIEADKVHQFLMGPDDELYSKVGS